MRTMKWLFEIWRKKKRLAAFLVVMSVLNAALAVAYPYFLRAVIDGITSRASSEFIARNILYLIAVGFVNFVAYSFMMGTRAWTNIRLERDLRQRMFEHIIRLGRGFFQKFRTGDIVTRLTDDLSTDMKLPWFVCSGIFRTVEALCMIVFGLAVMIRLNPTLTLAAVGPLPILIVIFMATASAVESRYERLQRRISDVNDHMEACFSGIRVVKAYGRERSQQKSFHEVMARRRKAEIDAVKVGTIVQSMYGYIWQFGVVIVLLVGGKMAMDGTLSLGTLVAFDAYVLMLVFPMYDIGTFFVMGKRAGVSIRRMNGMEDVEPEITEVPSPKTLALMHVAPEGADGGAADGAAAGGPAVPTDAEQQQEAATTKGLVAAGTAPEAARRVAALSAMPAVPAPAFRGVLRFEDVSLVYPSGRKVLDRVSFEVKPGEMVALVGRVGSGKSSVVNLIPRLIDPTGGRIMLNGTAANELSLDSLRRLVGCVPQEALLFSDTIENNIKFHRDWVTDDDVVRAAEVARLMQEIYVFPDGLKTKIGQRGVTISGGQKQRVALARALAGRPGILILDDCTASLDAQTEAALWDGLRQVFPTCITLIVSHRAATLEKANQILVLEHGAIVERGTHDELVEKRGVYHTLYELGKLEDEVGRDWGQ
ncbi:MAG: ABC transporter ATP-binding protein [Candidatus Eisenbacteria bacterium]|nr:ABC transporter ATP-binding protein [Candidatus Eisenbacteria bacterium]